MEEQLRLRDEELHHLRLGITLIRQKNSRLFASLSTATAQLETNYSLLCNEHRKKLWGNQTTKASQALTHLRELNLRAAAEQSAKLEKINVHLEETIAALEATHISNHERITQLQDQCQQLRQKVKKYQMRCLRAPTVTSNVVMRAKLNSAIFKLTKGGKFTSIARSLMRKLVKHGCSQEFVGVVIEDVCKAAGMKVDQRVSRRTVGRSIGEGAVAAKIQIIDEMAHASGFTISGDGTSHRNQEYMGRHVNVKAPTYTDDSPAIPRTRLLSIDSDTDHSSETQVRGWLETITAYSDLYNRCPPIRQQAMHFSLTNFFWKLRGMHGDHAADGKKDHCILSELKAQFQLLDLGTRQFIASSPEQLEVITEKAHKGAIEDAGGPEAWDALPREERDKRNLAAMNELKISFGEDVYDAMTDDEKRRFDRCLWGGCCMHKDLNATKGGAEGMKAWWKSRPDIQGPILLANRDNAATLADAPDIAAETNPSQRRALAATESGGVKTTLLAGALFNHANDKKGLQETHVMYFETIKAGRSRRFPGTSTTRYGSNLDAAAELITYLNDYINLLEEVRDKKEKMNFNHLEQNIYNALHDNPTLTELCAMVFYAEAISYPFAARVRGPDTERINLLDLGPFHQEVKAHVEAIIEDPDIITSPHASYEEATLDGKAW
ncbi:hypothetical protein B0H16DRAFT_1340269 [Mycena metata]|uniref:Uncharacterized protein n=1 Tax=Mycena metata TaxID=1033252 RepID=A0AAD7MG97_9AGAR|nr:hypothetical protein B0H16DRAFT_1340269 [Mycena metata]